MKITRNYCQIYDCIRSEKVLPDEQDTDYLKHIKLNHSKTYHAMLREGKYFSPENDFEPRELPDWFIDKTAKVPLTHEV